MTVRTAINSQVGVEFARINSHRRGFLSIYRPFENPEFSAIKYYGNVGDLLCSDSLPYGVWIIEVDECDRKEKHLIRWNENEKRWENLGLVRTGCL